MRIIVSVDTTAGRRRLELIVRALTDLQPPLRAFGAYLRAKFKSRFAAEGPGWPPLAQSTGHRLIHTYTGRVTHAGRLRKTESLRQLKRKIARDVIRGRLDASVFYALQAATRSSGGGGLGAAIRLHVAGHESERQLVRLSREYDRAALGRRRRQTRAITKHHRLLGKLASTIRAQLEGNAIRVGSFVSWAGIQNEGGVAGHNAQIPARTFAEVEEDDVDVLAETLLNHGIGAAPHPI